MLLSEVIEDILLCEGSRKKKKKEREKWYSFWHGFWLHQNVIDELLGKKKDDEDPDEYGTTDQNLATSDAKTAKSSPKPSDGNVTSTPSGGPTTGGNGGSSGSGGGTAPSNSGASAGASSGSASGGGASSGGSA